MSRARSIYFNGEKHWFDTHKDNQPANPNHLELLAAVEDIEIDDLLDEGLNQGAIIARLREALGQGVIPAEVLERKRLRREQQQYDRVCRICSINGENCGGKITRHHFIPRWAMKELDNYQAYARRDRCTIPICIETHRDLHMRNRGNKSIIKYLTDHERHFAHKMLRELEEQHPKIMALFRKGDPEVSYEACLVRDYDEDKFAVESDLTSSVQSVYSIDTALVGGV